MVAVDTAHFQSFKTQLFGHTMYLSVFFYDSRCTQQLYHYTFLPLEAASPPRAGN